MLFSEFSLSQYVFSESTFVFNLDFCFYMTQGTFRYFFLFQYVFSESSKPNTTEISSPRLDSAIVNLEIEKMGEAVGVEASTNSPSLPLTVLVVHVSFLTLSL